ncbi:hypothetical protein CHUAL_004245 [Chamberlinius hualienensis]
MDTCNRMKFIIVILGCFLPFIITVDRTNFKTCDQSGFCKRNRNTKPNQFDLLMNSLKILSNSVECELLNTETNVHYKLFLYGLRDSTFRLKIEELKPLRPRFQPLIALINIPVAETIEVVNRDAAGFTVILGKNRAVVTAKPFRIDLYTGDELVISANGRGLMKFEHSREKPTPKENKVEEVAEGENPPPPAEVVDEPVEEDEPGMWEETFKSHHDSKLNGPMSVGMDFSFIGFDNVYGIPEHADHFSLQSTKSTDPYRLFNLDVFEYELYNPMALYGSIPYMVAHSEVSTVGLLWLNAAEMWVDIAPSSEQNVVLSIVDFVKGQTRIPQMDTHWFAETGILDFFFFLGPTPADVTRQYSYLTGTTQVPPIFSLGYHQCRWNYNDQDDVRDVNNKFDEFDIPLDVIWLDIEYTDGKRYFTWDKTKFPEPKEMIMNLTAKGRKMVTIIDPHIKRASGYFVHEEATSKGYYVKNKDGNDYEGWCWPGSSSYLDFVNPEIRNYWSSLYSYDKFEGSTSSLHTWNDMNEPSVFNGPEVTMPKDCKHINGWEHRDVHNIYGLYVIQSTHKGLLDRSKLKERPFILSRAFFISIQRYSAVWTGDNLASWEHLKISVPMMLSLSLSGVTFSGADVGGFFQNPDAELLVRWYQTGAFLPFFRAHAHVDTKRREPYLLEENDMKIVRETIRKRYSYLPYWYTLFYENELSSTLPMRPVWFEFPKDKATFKIEYEYMIGNALLVRPVVEQSVSSVEVYLPGENEVWYDSDTYERFHKAQTIKVNVPLSKIPVYLRGGRIIPKKERVRRSASLGTDDPYTLLVTLDESGKFANGTVYIDDGFSFDYKRGKFIYRVVTFSDNTLSSKSIGTKSTYKTKSWLERIVLIGIKHQPKSVIIDDENGNRNADVIMDTQRQVLTIRKPSVNMGDDWKITLN